MATRAQRLAAERERIELTNEAYNAADEEQVAAKKNKSKATGNLYFECLESILNTQEGRAFIFDLFGKCRMFQNPYVMGDDKATYINIGKQSFGTDLFNDVMSLNPESYLQMLEENNNS